MAMMPGAKNRLLANQARQGRMKSYQGVCLHTMVGTLAGTDSMFQKNGTVGTESHFGVGEEGEIYQWVDTKYTADANYLGSGHVISIETADYGGSFGRWNTSGDNVPYWNTKQIVAIVKIIVWACKTHDIPIQKMKTVRDRGIGYHAMGVPGNELPNSLRGTRYQWSKFPGKVCPGKKRISQVPEIVRLAKNGTTTLTPAKKGLFDMALKANADRTEKRPVAKGKEITLRTHRKNTNSLLASVKNGELFQLNAFLIISGLREGQVAEVWCRVGEYVKSSKKGYTRYNHKRVTVIGRAGGGDVHVEYTLTDKNGIGPKHKGDPRLYLIVKNVSGDECTVEAVKWHLLAD